MTTTKDILITPKQKYSAMPRGKRIPFIPQQGYCSTAPAKFYQDALVSAYHGVKMMVFGDPAHDTIVFNHEKLYTKHFSDNIQPPNLAPILPDVRKLLLEGNSVEACALAAQTAREQGYQERMHWVGDLEIPHSNYQMHSACIMKIELDTQGDVSNYLRTMNFKTSEACIHWQMGNESFVRKAFVAAKDNLCIQKFKTDSASGISGNLCLTLDGVLGKHDWEKMDTPKDMTVTSTFSADTLTLACKYNATTMGTKGYVVVTKISGDPSTFSLQQNTITLKNATDVTLFTLISPLEECNPSTVSEAQQFVANINYDYDEALQYNSHLLGEKMERSRLQFAQDEEKSLSVEELITSQHSDQELSPTLIEKLYDIGRYFLITESGEVPPAIGQCNINVNLQVCAGNLTNLPESMEVFFRFVESKIDDFKVNAQNIFGCRGMVAPVHLDPDNGLATHFSVTWPHQYWVACAAWLYNEFWGHYLVTGDEDFLKNRVVPALREIALFFEDYLVDTDQNGNFLFYPCYSPEHNPGHGWSGVTINSCMDIMVCREVLENLLIAYRTLGITGDETTQWESMLQKLPTYLTDEEGGLKEWAWASIPEEYDHRHVSHHYDVWPGNGITWEKTPNLAKAVLISNRKRGQENDSAHGIMHRLFTAIRLKDTSSVYLYLRQILDHGFINKNLMTNHYPHSVFFPDITGSLPAAFAEMLVYSNPGIVELLPACPSTLSKGCLSELCCYTFAKINDFNWDLSQGVITLSLTSWKEQTIKLGHRHHDFSITVDGSPREVADRNCALSLQKNQTATIKLLLS